MNITCNFLLFVPVFNSNLCMQSCNFLSVRLSWSIIIIIIDKNTQNYFVFFTAGHLVLSANSSLFVELMDHLLAELKQNASHSTTRTFIQCIGAIW